jgi:hypothetical protein
MRSSVLFREERSRTYSKEEDADNPDPAREPGTTVLSLPQPGTGL